MSTLEALAAFLDHPGVGEPRAAECFRAAMPLHVKMTLLNDARATPELHRGGIKDVSQRAQQVHGPPTTKEEVYTLRVARLPQDGEKQCAHFEQFGWCGYGAKCRFAHTVRAAAAAAGEAAEVSEDDKEQKADCSTSIYV